MSLNIGAILISNKILTDKQIPGWMYREKSIARGDSGWRVFLGTEDDDYLNNASNFRTISADQLIEIDDLLKINLFAPIGSSFERDFEGNHWVQINMG